MRTSPAPLLCLFGTLSCSILLSPVTSQTLGPEFNIGDGLITDIQRAPGDTTNLYVVTRAGRIHIIPQRFDGTESKSVFLDISSSALASNERGLLGLAFHPDYATNKYFYVNYIMSANGDTRIARFTAIDATTADPSSEEELETIIQPYTNHNGGALQFGPDGHLYIAMGDGGSGGDPQNFAQNMNSLLGKMLRINVNGVNGWKAAGSTITIAEGYNETIWADGLRNPWRFSFDDATGDMFIADVGQNAYEEVNFQSSLSDGGENYGWRPCEGLSGYNPSGTNCGAGSTPVPRYAAPIFDYAQSTGNFGRSITGGYVYRGLSTSLNGIYFYGDYTSGWIFGAKTTSGTWGDGSTINRNFIEIDSPSAPTTFGQDSGGELYVGYSNGFVQRILTPAATEGPTRSATLPPTLSVMPSEIPTETPTRAPFAVSVTCPAAYNQTRVIDTGLTLHYSIVVDADVGSTYGGLFCAQLEYEGLGWLGFGVSGCPPSEIDNNLCSKMADSEVVIADPGANTVQKYKLEGTQGANLVDAQTLIEASMIQTATDTIMTYTKLLKEPNEFEILSNAQNLFVWAIGPQNFPSKHNTKGFFILDQTPCPPLDQCPGGQICRAPPCTECGSCSSQDTCTSTAGCTWQQGGFACSGGSRCSQCTTSLSCGQAGCGWNGRKCSGGDQTPLISTCSGTATPVSTCDANCGDGVCDATETSCSCENDCGTPPATETLCGDGIDDDCDGLVDCDDPDCDGDALCGVCQDPVRCDFDSECCSNNCRQNGRWANTCSAL